MAIPAVSSCGSVVWCGGSDGRVRGWAASTGKLLLETDVLTESKPPQIVTAWPMSHGHALSATTHGHGSRCDGYPIVAAPLWISTDETPLARLQFSVSI